MKLKYLAMLLSLAVLLGGCGKTAEAPAAENKETEPTAPIQQEMPQAELNTALRQTELQLIAATLETESQYNMLFSPASPHTAICADLDGDGRDELIGTLHALIFDPDDRSRIGATFTQSGVEYYTDKDGNLYWEDSIGDFFTETVDGKELEFSGGLITYHSYTGGPTIKTRNCVAYLEDKEVLRQSVTIGSQEYTWEEGQKKLEDMGLTEVTTTPGDFTVATYDTVYTASLVSGLDSYFTELYPAYEGSFTADIDGDGLEETGFLIPDLMDDWLAPYQELKEGQDGMVNWLVNSQFANQTEYTGFLLVDPGREQVTVRAGCSRGDLQSSGDALTYENHILTCGGARCYLPASGQDIVSYAHGITLLMEGDTYHNIFMKQVDVADIPGTELLCVDQLSRSADLWSVHLFALRDGIPIPIYWNSLNNSSFYISTVEGKSALLLYTQQMDNFGDYRTSYSYRLLRFDAEGAETELDAHSVSYTKDQSDGTEAAAFFAKLEPYLQKLTVIYDPFKLTGQQWLSPEDTDAGTPPEEPKVETPSGETEPETEEATLGFVQVESEKSWLHLRVGPGTNYDKVLTNPEDPSSFVRQALGSPVTILETVETDDPENPVWVKIRITYQGTEIIGYSSKTYIRTAE